MRVVEVTAYGGPEVLRMARRPEPEAGDVPGRVRVRLKAAGVNQADLRIRAGFYADVVGALKPPFVLGTDFAGKLLDPVPGLAPGTRVAGFVPWYQELTGEGTYAEVVRVAPEWLAPIPDDVEFTVAVSVPWPRPRPSRPSTGSRSRRARRWWSPARVPWWAASRSSTPPRPDCGSWPSPTRATRAN